MRNTPSMDDSEERRAIARIEQALASLGSEYSPPAGWQERVLREIGPDKMPPKHSWERLWKQWRWAVPVGALAAAAAALVVWRIIPPEPASVAPMHLALSEAPSSVVKMSGENKCSVGRTYIVEGSGDGSYRQLRLYRDQSLSFLCEPGKPGGTAALAPPNTDAASCSTAGGKLTLRWTPALTGKYQVVGISSSRPIPGSKNHLDRDLGALMEAGIETAQLPAMDCN